MRAVATLLLLLAACDRGPEVPTSADNRDLDEVGRMLDNADGNLANIDDGALQPRDSNPEK